MAVHLGVAVAFVMVLVATVLSCVIMMTIDMLQPCYINHDDN